MTIRPYQASDRAAVLVAAEGSQIQGSVMVGDDGHRGWGYYLSVQPALRSSGLGQKLMTSAEDWLRERGCRKIELMVRNSNDAVIGFYEAKCSIPADQIALVALRFSWHAVF